MYVHVSNQIKTEQVRLFWKIIKERKPLRYGLLEGNKSYENNAVGLSYSK